jgi:hypothetical protein
MTAAVVVVVALVVGGLAAGWMIAGRQVWAPWGSAMGRGMMAWDTNPAQPCAAGGQTCAGGGVQLYGSTSGSGEHLTIDEAYKSVEKYVDSLGYRNLEIDELMEFERNFYAIVAEHDTGIGAMELLVDKGTGRVGPEMGPNMMWNTRYGMHRGGGMMGQASAVNTIKPEEAIAIAARWLETNRPRVSVEEHADPFYGYYTIHTLKDGEIEGMLSVHGTTGQVWYHNWHGAFVQMIEEEDPH